jgi:hypothetical protein
MCHASRLPELLVMAKAAGLRAGTTHVMADKARVAVSLAAVRSC